MMRSLKEETVVTLLMKLPEEIKDILQKTNSYLAGGYIRDIVAGDKPNDIDIFIDSAELYKAEHILRKQEYEKGFSSRNATTWKNGDNEVQLITT